MNPPSADFSRRYQETLRAHLKRGRPAGMQPAREVGLQALAGGLQTLDLARLHEKTLVEGLLPGYPIGKRAACIKKAAAFFSVAMLPIEKSHRGGSSNTTQLKKIVTELSRRTVELAASNMELNLEIAQRRLVEEALKKSELHYSKLLKQSDSLQDQLRQLSRQILSAQEEERKHISRELHDVIAQTLTGINLRLATLKKDAAVNTRGLERNIALTQRLVAKSVDIVQRFARELRPALLDELGLIPALHAFAKAFSKRTGILVHLKSYSGVEQLTIAKRTVLFRVAQEALTNVSRHANAGRVEVTIRKLRDGARLEIWDDGKSFQVERTLHTNGGKRLGLLGMRERVEMIGGKFEIQSAPGKGTVITAQIPQRNAKRV